MEEKGRGIEGGMKGRPIQLKLLLWIHVPTTHHSSSHLTMLSNLFITPFSPTNPLVKSWEEFRVREVKVPHTTGRDSAVARSSNWL